MKPICSALVALMLSAVAAANPPAGRWKLLSVRDWETELVVAVVEFAKADDGSWTGRLVTRNPALGQVTVGGVTVANGVLRVAMKLSDDDATFEGVVTDNAYAIHGTLGDDRRHSTARLIPTDDERISRDTMTSRRELPPPLQDHVKALAERAELDRLMAKASDVDLERLAGERRHLVERMARETPRLFERALAEHRDHPATLAAMLELVGGAYRCPPNADSLRSWVNAAREAAGRFGPRCRRETDRKLIAALGRSPAFAAPAVELARDVDGRLPVDAPPAEREAVLRVLVAGLNALGKEREAADAATRLDALDRRLEEEFLRRVPKFTVKPFEKRKPKANRVALAELFCGAPCPASPAAMLAFDRLPDVYKPTEAIVLTYHLHRTGPDALANPDAQARWESYADRLPEATASFPVACFNGVPRAPGGGPPTRTRDKLDEYLRYVNEVLAETTQVTLSLSATRKGDRIELRAAVDNAGDDLTGVRLRLALVEESVRYSGGNGVRTHRRVVRAMPGGPAGLRLDRSDTKHTATVNLAEVRATALAALDEHARVVAPLPSPDRPMSLAKIKAVAWVQDDRDGFVWQAIESEVTDAKP